MWRFRSCRRWANTPFLGEDDIREEAVKGDACQALLREAPPIGLPYGAGEGTPLHPHGVGGRLTPEAAEEDVVDMRYVCTD